MSEIKRLRQERGLSRDELAALSGISSLTIRAHELATVNGTETKTAEAIAHALGVPVHALFFPSDINKSEKIGYSENGVGV
ncbi:helix-turn-helix transcriptional regulator [Deinococcus phoenicis]|uniref:helix-turn-helix transcriptional regulator n=1 Tax=Deinococcus phoenicis TaxID=1476583 RepID=UPI00190F7C38|nr:helix-turn-helix transcriptional regulator [Deinococcus phoenicis]